jgi:hypothetical protein
LFVDESPIKRVHLELDAFQLISELAGLIIKPSTYSIGGVDQGHVPNKYSIEIYLVGNIVSRDSSFLRVYQDGPQTV